MLQSSEEKKDDQLTGNIPLIDEKVTIKMPNTKTIAAMIELKAGKGTKFKNVEELFNSIR